MMDITGKKDAMYLKKRYQEKLNQQHKVIGDKRHFVYKMNHKLKSALGDIQKFASDIEANQEERANLYNSLQNMLSKETDFEEKMLKLSQKGKKVKSIIINQKFKDSDIEEARYDTMREYLEKYPKYASKSSFSEIIEQIKKIESGIKKTKTDMNKAVSDALKEISYFPRNILEFRDIVKKYQDILKEGKEKTENNRYVKSFLFKLLSEEEKQKMLIDTINHNPEHFETSINQIEKEFKKAEEEIITLKKKFNI
ncbi:MAG: LemA family protein [Candidatus Nanoarchaeia archaeon]|jgi:hypothetical protein